MGCSGAGVTPFKSIVRATAQEILSEPLSLLVLIASLALAVFAPAIHYHQFGDPTRMARDAGCSALFTGGLVTAVFGILRSFRREIETGTAQMALARPVSRTGFFFAKTAGGFAAYLVFAFILFAALLAMVEGAAIGGEIAAQTGDIARVYGPLLAAGVALLLVPLVAGAVLNRFGRCRFVLTCFVTAFVLAGAIVLGLAVFKGAAVPRLLAVALPSVAFAAVFLAAAAAFSVRLKANAATSAVGVVFVLLLPCVGNYYLPEALARGGSLPWSTVAFAFGAAAPAVLFFLLLGCRFVRGLE